jgi:hypothetical protein
VKAGGVLAAVAAALVLLPAPAGASAPTSTQLALMPLPRAALGGAALKLPLDQDSGIVANADAAQNANGHVTSAQLVRLGRITGYQLDYDDHAGGALLRGHGLLQVTTGVDVYGSADAAHKALAFWKKDELLPTTLGATGLSLALTKVTVSGLGPDGFAYAGVARVKGKPTVYGVDVAFRSGQLLGRISVSAADRDSTVPLASRLTAALLSRIGGVLAGKVKGPPVQLPAKAKAGPPPQGPPLDRLTLRPRDVGGGTVKTQGYRLDKNLSPISEYERDMSPGGGFPFLEEQVALFHSPLEAGYAVSSIGKVLSSPNAGKLLAGLSGVAFSSFHATKVSLGVGDESYGTIARVGLQSGQTIGEAFAEIRIGSTTEALIVGAVVGAITPRALVRLAQAAVKRATAGLHP